MTGEQFGFRKKSSTSMAIANLQEYILKELDCNREVVSVFILVLQKRLIKSTMIFCCIS